MIGIQDIISTTKRYTSFSLSFLVHILLLLIFASVTWYMPAQQKEEDPVASIILHGQREDRLKFQEKDHLDSFKVQDKMVYPLPEIEYRPVMPDITYYPEPKVEETFDLIGIEAMDRTWLNPSTGRQPLYTGEERLAGSFTRHIQMLREGGLDIVFVFDSTSSMAEFLRQVKFKITNLVAAFKKLVPTARIGLVTYRDVDADFVTKVHPLTYGTKSLKAFLQEIDPEGGGDREEAVDEALRVAIDELNWKEKSKKIILLIGDAPPHQEDMVKTTNLIGKFRNNMGGVIAALDTSGQTFTSLDGRRNTSVLQEFKLFADIGGGESARLVDEERVIRQMVVLVFGSRWEVCLDEFLKNL